MVAAVLAVTGGAPAHGADLDAGRHKAEPCKTCHGPDGNATTPGIPSLAGQPAIFTHWQLIKFREGRRKDPQMSAFAASLSDADMADLAAYYAAQPPRPRPSPTDPEKVAIGGRLAEQHHCASCHRPGLVGHEQVPRLVGQDLTYLVKLLRGFKAQTAGDLDGTMSMAVERLSEADIENLAHYIADLSGRSARP